MKQILAFSRKSPETRKAVMTARIVREAIRLLRSSIPCTIEITERINTEAATMADPDQLHQVIMNLATNAFHPMEKTGGA